MAACARAGLEQGEVGVVDVLGVGAAGQSLTGRFAPWRERRRDAIYLRQLRSELLQLGRLRRAWQACVLGRDGGVTARGSGLGRVSEALVGHLAVDDLAGLDGGFAVPWVVGVAHELGDLVHHWRRGRRVAVHVGPDVHLRVES